MAFYNCFNLEKVYYNGTESQFNKIEFVDDASNPIEFSIHFYVLDEKKEYYEVLQDTNLEE